MQDTKKLERSLFTTLTANLIKHHWSRYARRPHIHMIADVWKGYNNAGETLSKDQLGCQAKLDSLLHQYREEIMLSKCSLL